MTLQKHQIPAFKIHLDHQFPEMVTYWHKNFEGESWRTNLSYLYVGDHWNQMISSLVVVAGIWEFWSDSDFTGNCCQLGPGYYPDFKEECSPMVFINKGISSFRCVSQF